MIKKPRENGVQKNTRSEYRGENIMSNNENIKDIIKVISDMVLEYINEKNLKKNSNESTA